MHPLLIVIPVYNEALSLPETLAPLAESGYHIVVVDDASCDNSREVALSFGAVVVSLPFRMGAWCATQAGMHYAMKYGYSEVVCMDGDAQHPAMYIGELCATMRRVNADVVVASNPQRGGTVRSYVRSALAFLSGAGVADITSGFRLVNRRALAVLCSERLTLCDYQDLAPLFLLRQHHMRVVETSAVFSSRKHGVSRMFGCFSGMVDYFGQSLFLVCCFAFSRCKVLLTRR